MLSIQNLDFYQIKNQWDSLFAKSKEATFFQSFLWQKVSLVHLRDEFDELKVYGVYEEKKLIGIIPIAIRKGVVYLNGEIPVLGKEAICDYGDIIVWKNSNYICWQEIIKILLRDFGKNFKLRLLSVRSGISTVSSLEKIAGNLNLNFKKKQNGMTVYLSLPKSWDEYLQLLGRHQRHELKRKMRKLGGEYVFKTGLTGNEFAAKDFLRLMGLSSDQKGKFLKPKMQSYFIDLIGDLADEKMLNLGFLNYEGKNIAGTLSVNFRDEVWLYNCGFDPVYSYLSPGLLLKSFLIKEAISKGKKGFDFLRGGERYKFDLGGKPRKLYSIEIEN